jgi:crotonobetainyl-CoA:carnitine CoA-transferase CaiB-like acyl-CoA transferase
VAGPAPGLSGETAPAGDPGRILAGVRVLDLSQGLAGPVAATLLAEAGADVVKIERPGHGDLLRGSPAFATWNRSKRGLTLDLGDHGDRRRFDELVADADVVLHSFLPRQAEALGLDVESLLTRHPRLVVCAIGGWPNRHPDRDRAAFDATVLAATGLLDEQAGARPGPVFLRFPLASWGAAHLAALGILARLAMRDRTGRGGPAHTSLFEGALSLATLVWARASTPTPTFATGLPRDMQATIFECGDGVWIHIPYTSVDEVPLMAAALATMGEPAVAEANAAFPKPVMRFPNFGANRRAFLLTGDSSTWLEALWAADVPALPVLPLGEILRDEQAELNGYIVEVEDAELGRVRQAGIPYTTSPPARVQGPAPRLGEHDGAVMVPPRAPEPDQPRAGSTPRWPLEGLRVVDFGQYIAGPFGAMLLADLGADVIKVEPPSGDALRFVEIPFVGSQRGKRSITVDLRKGEGARPVIEALARWADVVHHNMRMPAARRLGLGEEVLRALNPRLVYCHLTAYGPVGPRADWPGYDAVFQALAGWEDAGAGEGNDPLWLRFGMLDQLGGMESVFATLLALRARERTGQGQFVAASLLGASVLSASEVLLREDGTVSPYPRLDHDQLGIAPGYRMYRTVDGFVAVAALRPGELDRLRTVAAVEADEGIEAAFATWKADELAAALEQAGVCSERVRTDWLDEFFDDPVHRATRLVVEYPHPVYGSLEQIGALWDFGDTELRLDRAPPTLGQHSTEIATELGFTPQQIEELMANGVLGGV